MFKKDESRPVIKPSIKYEILMPDKKNGNFLLKFLKTSNDPISDYWFYN